MRERLRREQCCDVEQLLQGVRADHAGLVEERVHGGVRPSERGRVRAGGPAAGARLAALQRQDRLASRDAPGEARKLTGVAERLEVEQDDVCHLVLLPPLEQVVRRHVGLVADGHERGEPEVAARRSFEEREAERAALRREADVAGGNGPRGEGGVQPRRRRCDPEAVRAEQARPVRTHERQQLLLTHTSLGTVLGKAGRDDADRADARAQRRFGRGQDVLARDADDDELEVVRDLLDGRIRAHAADRLRVAVHRVGGAGELAGEDVAEELAADRAAARGRADDGDGSRLEEGT